MHMMENEEIISSAAIIVKQVNNKNNIDVSKQEVINTLKKEFNLSYKKAKKL